MKKLFFISLIMINGIWAMEKQPLHADPEESKELMACGICKVDLKEGDGVDLCPTGKHDFHEKCLDGWRFPHFLDDPDDPREKKSCPMCRAPLKTPFLESTPCALISGLGISAVLLLLSNVLSS